MKIVLVDPPDRTLLYPFTYTKAVADLFMGMMSVADRWQLYSGLSTGVYTASYLSTIYPSNTENDLLYVNATVIPSPTLVQAIQQLQPNELLIYNDTVIAGRGDTHIPQCIQTNTTKGYSTRYYLDAIIQFIYGWDLVKLNNFLIKSDFEKLVKGRKSAIFEIGVTGNHFFAEEGVKISNALINTQTGPVYLSKNVEIMEGACIRGPFYAGEGTVVKMRATIYGATSVGRQCVLGGEIKNSIIGNYSNKAHDGYLGDAIIGQWCNLGGGTTTSNIKNTAGDVYVQFPDKIKLNAGLKCGVLMGDYTRTAIQTSLNTGTFAGIACNIMGSENKSYIPSFSWGEKLYKIDKCLLHINRWKALKNEQLTTKEQTILEYLFKTLQ